MINKLKKIKERFDFISSEVIKPEIISNNKTYREYMKEYSNLQPLIEAYLSYEKLTNTIEENQQLLEIEDDKDLVEMLEQDIKDSKTKLVDLEEQIKILLLPKDENDDKNVIIEIRAGAGGDEASLFAGVLFRMYSMYADKNRFKVEILDINQTELGGIKEVSFLLKGDSAYKKLKFESGVHRVQRVPETESSGRIHTSTATVAVLPEQEEVDIEILDKDLKIDVYRSSGAGGQHVNTTDSAVRMTHLPTNIVVACQDERSQIKNREKAMNILKSKLYDHYKMQSDEQYANARKNQVGTGDRSERIRTYNYPQGRLTDHRINYTIYNLDAFLNGDIQDLIDNLLMTEQREKLAKA